MPEKLRRRGRPAIGVYAASTYSVRLPRSAHVSAVSGLPARRHARNGFTAPTVGREQPDHHCWVQHPVRRVDEV